MRIAASKFQNEVGALLSSKSFSSSKLRIFCAITKVTFLIVLADLALTSPTHAQVRQSELVRSSEPSNEDTIVVVARRGAYFRLRGSVLPDGSDSGVLARDGISSLRRIAPDVGLFDVNATQSSIAMRGAVGLDESAAADPSVAAYIDDFYVGRTTALRVRMPDLAQVIVLRGPQGTSYGRNALGGAVNFLSSAPSDQNEFDSSFGFNSLGSVEASLIGNVATSSDTRIRFGAYGTFGGNYIENELTGTELGGRDEFGVFGRMQAPVDDRNYFWLSASWQSQRSDIEPRFLEFNVRPELPAAVTINDDRVFQARDPETDINVGRLILKVGDSADRASGFQLIAGVQLSEASVLNNDFAPGGGSARILAIQTSDDDLSASVESRLWFAGDQWSVLSGLLVRWADTERSERFLLEPAAGSLATFIFGPEPKRNLVAQRSESIELSGFFSVSYEISNDFRLEAGARYTYERKNGRTAVVGDRPSFLLQSDPFDVTWTEDWSSLTPSVALSYAPSDEFELWLSWSRGFKAGGFTNSANNPTTALTPFNPEFADSFEAGLTFRPSESTELQLNLFQTNFRDLQTLLVRTDPQIGIVQEVVNAGRSRSRGVEATIDLRNREFELALFGSYIDARYTDFTIFSPGRGLLDFSGEQVPLTPEWSVRATVRAGERGVANSGIRPGASFHYRSPVSFFPDATQSQAIRSQTDFLDVSVWIGVPVLTGELQIAATNLLDQRPFTFANSASSSFYYTGAQLGAGAQFVYGTRASGRQFAIRFSQSF